MICLDMQEVPDSDQLESCVSMCGGTWVTSPQQADLAVHLVADTSARPHAVTPSHLLVRLHFPQLADVEHDWSTAMMQAHVLLADEDEHDWL